MALGQHDAAVSSIRPSPGNPGIACLFLYRGVVKLLYGTEELLGSVTL